MKDEIERIVRSDEEARQKVAAARVKARAIRTEASEKSGTVTAENLEKLATMKKADRERIVSAAHVKVRAIREETDRYLDKLAHRRETQWEALLQNAFERIVRS